MRHPRLLGAAKASFLSTNKQGIEKQYDSNRQLQQAPYAARYEFSEKRLSCLGVVGDQYKFPEKDFMLTSNSMRMTK